MLGSYLPEDMLRLWPRLEPPGKGILDPPPGTGIPDPARGIPDLSK